MRILLPAFLLLVISACASVNSPNQSTEMRDGTSANLLIQRLGAPDTIMPAANGNTLFSYTKVTSKAEVATSNSNPTTIVGPKGHAIAANIPLSPENTQTVSLKCTTVYEVNKQHQVVSVKSNGNGC